MSVEREGGGGGSLPCRSRPQKKWRHQKIHTHTHRHPEGGHCWVLHEAGKNMHSTSQRRGEGAGGEGGEEETERWSGWRWQRMDSTQGQVGV